MPKRRAASLEAITQWFQEAVVRPHETGKRGPRLAAAATVILPSKTLPPERRVAIYTDAYLARLIEALHDDFPSVTRFVGHDAFHELCRAYLERYPSHSWSLNPLGRKLPDFLTGKVNVPKREAVRALATVEVAMAEVFDEVAATPLTPADFAKLDSVQFITSKLTFVPTFRLIAVDYAVNPYIDAVRQERAQTPPLKKMKSWIAIYRKDFKVWRLDLREPAYQGLRVLQQKGRTVSSAVVAIAKAWKGKPDVLPAQIKQWFGEWASEGFFSKVSK